MQLFSGRLTQISTRCDALYQKTGAICQTLLFTIVPDLAYFFVCNEHALIIGKCTENSCYIIGTHKSRELGEIWPTSVHHPQHSGSFLDT